MIGYDIQIVKPRKGAKKLGGFSYYEDQPEDNTKPEEVKIPVVSGHPEIPNLLNDQRRAEDDRKLDQSIRLFYQNPKNQPEKPTTILGRDVRDISPLRPVQTVGGTQEAPIQTPEMVVTAKKPQYGSLSSSPPLSEAEQAYAKKIPVPSMDVYKENRERMQGMSQLLENLVNAPVRNVINPIAEGERQVIKGGGQLLSNLQVSPTGMMNLANPEENLRGLANILGGGFKTAVNTLPAVQALNAVQPAITKAAGVIGEKIGIPKEKAQDIANKITPFIFGLPVGIGSLASEEAKNLLDKSGALDGLKDEDKKLALDLVSNGLFLGVAGFGGKVYKSLKGKIASEKPRGQGGRFATKQPEIPQTTSEVQNAIQEQRPAQEIPRSGTGGENIVKGSEGVRPSQQGEEIAGTRQEAQVPSKKVISTAVETPEGLQIGEKPFDAHDDIAEQKNIKAPERKRKFIIKEGNELRVVGRKEAAKVASEAGQITEPVKELHSEDLRKEILPSAEQQTSDLPSLEEKQAIDNNAPAIQRLAQQNKTPQEISTALNIPVEEVNKIIGEQGKTISLGDVVPDDAMKILGKRFLQSAGTKLPIKYYQEGIKLKDLLDGFAKLGLDEEIVKEANNALYNAGYRKIGDALITSEGLKTKEEINPLSTEKPEELGEPKNEAQSSPMPLETAQEQAPPEAKLRINPEQSAEKTTEQPKENIEQKPQEDITFGTGLGQVISSVADGAKKIGDWFSKQAEKSKKESSLKEQVGDAVKAWDEDVQEGILRGKQFTHQLRNELTQQDLDNLPMFAEGEKVPVSDKAKELLPEIRKVYDTIFESEKKSGLIGDESYKEDYFNRLYEQPTKRVVNQDGKLLKVFYDDKEAQAFAKDNKGTVEDVNAKDLKTYATRFTRFDPFLKKRVFEKMSDARDFGFKFKTTNAADLLDTRIQYATKVQANLRLNKMLSDMVDEQGNPLLMRIDKAPQDWDFVKNTGLNRAIGHVTEDGTVVLSKIPVKANPAIGDLVNIISDTKIDHPIFRGVEALNTYGKFANLTASFFHHIALTLESLPFMNRRLFMEMTNPKTLASDLIGFKNLKTLENNRVLGVLAKKINESQNIIWRKPELSADAVKHGLKITAPSEVSRFQVEGLTTKLADIADKVGKKVGEKVVGWNYPQFAEKAGKVTGKIISSPFDLVDEVIGANNRLLWEHIHPTAKLMTYEKLTEDGIRRNPNLSIDKIKEDAANFTNDVYGGLNWDRMMVDPKTRQILSLLLLAEDWTTSRIRTFYKMGGGTPLEKLMDTIMKRQKTLGGKVQGQYARRYWAKAAVGFAMTANLANYALTSYFGDKGEDGKGKFLWENDPGERTSIFIGHNSDGTKRYLRWGKAFLEPFEWIAEPMKVLGSKSSVVIRAIKDQSESRNFEPGFESQNFWEQLPSRLKVLGAEALPFSIRGNQFIASLPTSKGITPYKAVQGIRDAIMTEDNKSLKDYLIGAQGNKLNTSSMLKGALSAIRAENEGKLISQLKNLQRQKDFGGITDKDFEEKQKELLGQIQEIRAKIEKSVKYINEIKFDRLGIR